MIDPTNIPAALDHAGQAVQAGKSFWVANGATILAFALWLRAELKKILEYIIGHGGLGLLLWKLFWNPPAKEAVINPRPQPQGEKTDL